MYDYSRDIETLIVFGTYNREEVAYKSLKSLIEATDGYNVKIVVSDSSPSRSQNFNLLNLNPDEYLWTPRRLSMASARNIAVSLGQEKYNFDWLLFLEDDIEYDKRWYPSLLEKAKKLYGTKSVLGLAHGIFTASPMGVKNDELTKYDKEHDIYVAPFGPRADQRLIKTTHYNNISKFWESDLLGISSAQTGKVINRSLMQGYCAVSIGHLGLCKFLDEDESTWVGIRDIGPAAFDKRIEGYRSIYIAAEDKFDNTVSVYRTGDIKPQTFIPMTLSLIHI